MKFTEEMLKDYARPLSDTENEKCLNAIRMIRDALKDLGFTDNNTEIEPLYEHTYAYTLTMENTKTSRKIKLFLQGSYANNTNVRTTSDVDVAIIQEDVFESKYRVGITRKDYNFITVDAPLKKFKNEVEEYLKRKFKGDVERKNKSIKINGNTYRKDADAVPARRYRNYENDYKNNPQNYQAGIVILSDEGERIVNYPEQHIDNGREKNNNTNHRYKKMVRIMKKMRYIMKDAGYTSADKVSSFALESLVWNIPDSTFKKYTIYRYLFDEIIKYIYENKVYIYNYKEANGIKKLCPSNNEKDNLVNFINDLKKFYEYDI